MQEELAVFIKNNLDDWLGNTLTVSSISEEIDRRHRMCREEIQVNFNKSHRIAESMNSMQIQVALIQDELRRIRAEQSNLRLELDSRVHIQDISEIKTLLNQKCPIDLAISIQEDMKKQASSEELQKFVGTQRKLEEHMFNTFINKHQLDQSIEVSKSEIIKKLEDFSSKGDISDLSHDIFTVSSQAKKQIDELKTKLSYSNQFFLQSIESLTKSLETKAETADMDNVKDRLSDKASISALDHLSKQLLPQLQSCSKNTELITVEFEKQEKAIIRLDEVLLDKASKIDILTLSEKLDKISRHTDLEDKIDEMIEKLSFLGDTCQEHSLSLGQLKSHVLQMQKFYNKKSKESAKVKMLNQEILNLHTKLSCKTERAEIIQSLSQKTNYSDHLQLQAVVDDLEKHLKLLVTQIQTMQQVVADPDRAKGVEKLHREYLSRATQKLSDIITKSKSMDKTFLRTGTQTPMRKIRFFDKSR